METTGSGPLSRGLRSCFCSIPSGQSQIFRAGDSAWFALIQSLNPVPPAKSQIHKGGGVSSGIEMPELSARLMRHKHDGGHTQSLFALMLLLFRCPVPKGIGRNQPLPPLNPSRALRRIKQDSLKGVMSDLCFLAKDPTK